MNDKIMNMSVMNIKPKLNKKQSENPSNVIFRFL